MTFKPAKIIWIVFSVLIVEALFSVPLLSWELAFGGWRPGEVWFALAATIAVLAIIWTWREWWKRNVERISTKLAEFPAGYWLLACFLVGTILRVWWRWEYPAPQQSDQATYFNLARNLVLEHRYGFANGGLAYWPPGFPFFLSVWFYLFGFQAWVPLLANLFLYGGMLVVVMELARRMGGENSARLASVLLVPWPTVVMIAGFSGKELLVVFLLCLALLIFSMAMQTTNRGKELLFVGMTGAVLGGMSLTQPSFQLFPAVLIAYDYLCRGKALRSLARAVLMGMVMCAVILPWTLRNHRVLGVWVPISTNGGDVFYRANNGMATGGYTPQGEQSLDNLDEVSRGKTGFRLGVAWIESHPGKFLWLGVRKEILFLGDDAQGAYETLRRGLGIGGIRYAAWKAICNFYWWGLWALLFLLIATRWKSALAGNPLLAAAMLTVLYLLAIHSVFESGGKYHVPLVGILAAIAGQAAASEDGS